MTLELQKPYQLIDIILTVFEFYAKKADKFEDDYDLADLYVSLENVENYHPNTVIYLDETVSDADYDEKNNPEGYSQFVLDNQLKLFCYGYIFSDVMSVYCSQKQILDVDLFLKCLVHYLKYDDFLDVE